MSIVQGKYTGPLRKYLAADSTATAFASRVSIVTKPANYIQLDQLSVFPRPSTHIRGMRCKGLALYPIGADAADETFHFQITGWVRVVSITGDAGSSEGLDLANVLEYRPFPIWVALATLGTNAGTSGGLGTSVLFADTLLEVTSVPTAIDALSGFTVNVHSLADGTDAWVVIEDASHIFDGFTFEFDINAGAGGDAAGANLLIQSIY